MVKLCRTCGATPIPGARFCRGCGAPLNATGGAPGGEEVVSPQAQTIPLAGEGRPTDGISPVDAGYSSHDTSRVGQDEMERLFRHGAPPEDGSEPAPTAPEANQTPEVTAFARPSAGADVWDALPPTDGEAGRAEAKRAGGGSGRPRRIWQAIAAVLLCAALAAGALAYFYLRQPASVEPGGAQPIAISDQKKLVDEQLAEADALLAAGDLDGALGKLRYAVKLDPTNAEAHLKLGRALEQKGQRREAIEEYRAATAQDPANTFAWRALAHAQVSEGLYGDAADSYQRIIQTMDERAVDDNLRLEYADALRLAGRTEEARALYQRVSSSESMDLAHRASQQLAQLPAQTSSNGTTGTRDESATTAAQSRTNGQADEGEAKNSEAAPTQTVAASSSAPVVNNRPAEKSPDQIYQEALNIVQGRDVKTLHRAELLRALQLFQNVKGGSHSGEAKRQADRLGKEYDRRRKNE